MVSQAYDKASLLELMMQYNHLDTSKEDKRLIAVTAALELIRCDATGGNADLGAEIKNVGKYADQIQKAMKSEG
jgi:hypothetical protein